MRHAGPPADRCHAASHPRWNGPQVIKAVLKDPEDSTQLSLLYANVSPDDILLRDDLDALVAAHPGRFSVWYTGACVCEVAARNCA